MTVKASDEVRRIANRKYTDVTHEQLLEMYPTSEWQSRYAKTVYGGR